MGVIGFVGCVELVSRQAFFLTDGFKSVEYTSMDIYIYIYV